MLRLFIQVALRFMMTVTPIERLNRGTMMSLPLAYRRAEVELAQHQLNSGFIYRLAQSCDLLIRPFPYQPFALLLSRHSLLMFLGLLVGVSPWLSNSTELSYLTLFTLTLLISLSYGLLQAAYGRWLHQHYKLSTWQQLSLPLQVISDNPHRKRSVG